MTASKKLKGLLAGAAAVAVIGTAVAQGNPPNPEVKNAPMGAGQQSSQQTPMGTTGTPAGTGMAAGTSSTDMSTSGTTSSGTSMGATGASGDTTVAASGGSRRMRADRN